MGQRQMDFAYSPKVLALRNALRGFMDQHVYPMESAWFEHGRGSSRWEPIPWMEGLKQKARDAGLWNLWRPVTNGGELSNLEYAPLCETMGRVHWAMEIFNCSSPDTGNIDLILKFGLPKHHERWVQPLLEGKIRSAFLMTEPDHASSDATNIQCRIEKSVDGYVVNGRKCWAAGAGDPRCKVFVLMGKSDPANPDRHRQQSMLLVPSDAPGVRVTRALPVFGYEDAPQGVFEVELVNVQVERDALLLGEGRGFEIAQNRLGPGRLHHCMRLVGKAERAIESMCDRALVRSTFGKPLSQRTVTQERIAEARIAVNAARWMVLHAAWKLDTGGNKEARKEIAMIKVMAANTACKVIDWAIQVHGSYGLSDDFALAHAYAYARSQRIADGPDEIHRNMIAKLELEARAAMVTK